MNIIDLLINMRYYNSDSNRTNPFELIYAKFNNEHIPDFPYVVDIELTNHCNMNCIFCGQQTMKRSKGYMNRDTFENIIDECSKYNTGIRFIRWGEPLLHNEMIDYSWNITDGGLLLHITTNGLLLDKYIGDMLNFGLHSITISLQGATEKEYCLMRNNNFYSKIVDNIKRLHEMAKIYKHPYIQISSTMTNDNSEDIDEFVKFWLQYSDLVSIGKTDLSRININDIKSKIIKDKMMKLKKSESPLLYKLNCPDMFNKLAVDWNGDVTACCSDYDGFLVIGNINETSLYELWHSDKMDALRELMENNLHRCISLCSTCYSTDTEFE